MSASWNAVWSLINGLLWLAFLGAIILAIFVWRSHDSLRTLRTNIATALLGAQEAVDRRILDLNALAAALREKAAWKGANLTPLPVECTAADVISVYKAANTVASELRAAVQRNVSLKSDAQIVTLMDEVKRSEAEARKKVNAYDSSIRIYNSVRGGIPTVFYADLIGYSKAERLDPDIHEAASLADQFRETTVAATAARYFYMTSPGAVPKGPASAEDLRYLLEQGALPPSALIAEAGSDEWVSIDAVAARS